MKIYIGLGNPDKEHQKTRHNVGFMTIDALQQQKQLPGFTFQKKVQALVSKSPEVILVKPQAYMNNSGQVVRAVLDYYGIEINALEKQGPDQLFVIYDDLDIKLGSFKVQFGKGPKVHNGVLSIQHFLPDDNFWHVRIGIDGRGSQRVIAGKDYVLQSFTSGEQDVVDETIPNVIQTIESVINAGY